MLLSLVQAPAWADGRPEDDLPARSAAAEADHPDEVAPAQRERVLGKDWKKTGDRAWTTTSDADGFHLLVADARQGYSWRTAATLREPGFDTDAWIGNACVTGSGRRAVVVYAPRTFTNKAELFARGAFTAVVDLETGAVDKLNLQSTLAYFNPGCGADETAVLTQSGDEKLPRTRLVRLDAATGRLATPVETPGQVTSAVPVAGGGVVAAHRDGVVKVDQHGKRTRLAAADGFPFQLAPDADGGVVYMDRTGKDTARFNRLPAVDVRTPGARGTRPNVLAEGPLTGVDLARGAGGKVYLTGKLDKLAAKLPASVEPLRGVPADARVSTRGKAVLTRTVFADGKDPRVNTATTARPAAIDMTVRDTRRQVSFTVDPANRNGAKAAEGLAASPALGTPAAPAPKRSRKAAARSSAVAEGPDQRYCAVPRNDPANQAMQPKPRQVEWAVDQAVMGTLDQNISRPANWKNLGMPAYSPQKLFPKVELDGGGHVPAQVMLGITAQESNLWQASRVVVPGATGNPLVGSFYGQKFKPGKGESVWDIHWDKADCGYGVTQVTDGMRLAGKEKPGETALPYQTQRAVALDYATNIAAGLRIVSDKWNQIRRAGMTANNGDPKRPESWFYALWAYNSGFYPESDKGKNAGAWGLGWANNPANPVYKVNRMPFMASGARDAAHPQDWPYQEKVLGFAAYPPDALEAPGKLVAAFRAAWWMSDSARNGLKPLVSDFCKKDKNDCDPGRIASSEGQDGPGACTRDDFKCWWHDSVEWHKPCAEMCGNELLRFDSSYKEEADGTAYQPECGTAHLPKGALVVDDVPDGTPIVRPGCYPMKQNGSFDLDFASDSAKVDFQQIGGGYGGHFWFAHTRKAGDEGGRMKVTGTWKFDDSLNQWGRVLVHTPDHGAHTRQARYDIYTGKAKKSRVMPQRTQKNAWVSLGVFEFVGTPRISLDSETLDGAGEEDIAFDAVAIEPLPGKPRNVVVALGDSYSSGEGASVSGGGDYYPETDVDGKKGSPWRDACHRSRYAWSRQASFADSGKSIGERADELDQSMDYHLLACSGAKTSNVLPGGKPQYGELPQLDQGYLDDSTTLVTMSIGGNDADFSKVFKTCLIGTPVNCADNTRSDGKTNRAAERELIHDTVRPAIATTLKKIHELAPNARIVLMGYPPLISGDSKCLHWTPPTGPLGGEFDINADEAKWLNEVAVDLAEQMDGAAKDAFQQSGAPVYFSNPAKFFQGKGICGNPETIHGIVTDKTPGDDPDLTDQPVSAQSFHPKIAGARLYAYSLEETLRAVGL
ncbi:GDSL-type esterase/lipase family protein [Streptomyces sp. URMC 126]|uniref:GDSL-type esterase/lipase family protein n=2 Tax=Actinomycetes TaxID=1760 RepID=UPI003F1B83DF